MGLGIAGALALKRARRRGGGDGSVTWVALDAPFVQASDTPVDSIPIASAEAFDPDSKFLQVTFNTDTAANRAGFRSGGVYLTKKISDVLPEFDPTIHELLAYVDKGDTDSGTGEILCALCVIDESTPSATANGTGGGWTQSSGTTDGVSVVQATAASVSNASSAPLNGVFLRFNFVLSAASTWDVQMTVSGDASGLYAPGPNPVHNNTIDTTPEECWFCLLIGKRLTDNINGQTAEVRAHVGYRLRSARPVVSILSRLPLPTGTDEEVILLIGDSYGTQGESLDVLAGDAVDENGFTTTGPATLTTASVIKGYYERVKELRPGCTITAWNHSVATITMPVVLNSHWVLARNRMLTAGKVPTAILVCCGTNSSGTGESANAIGHARAFLQRAMNRFPSARVAWLGPFVDEDNAAPGGLPAQARPEAGIVREAIRAACAEVGATFIDARDYAGDPDEIHLAAASLTAVGRDMADGIYGV